MKPEFDINTVIGDIDFAKDQLVDVGNGMFLTNHEIEVLNRYDVSYKKCHNLKEILFELEEVLNDMDIVDEELEYVSSMIAERDYYQNTNK